MNRDEICQHIPHAGDMCLLDTVESWDSGQILCSSQSHRSQNNPLQKDGVIPAVCLVEYAAQAMAVHGGLSNIDTSVIGYLASVRNLQLTDRTLEQYQAPLKIHASKLAADASSQVYQFRVEVDDEVIASGRAAVILQPGETP